MVDENLKKKEEGLLKNIGLFFLSSFIPKTIAFFMVPLYTLCLSTEEYGNIDLVTTTVQLLLPVFTLQVQDAIMKFSITNSKNAGDIFSVGLDIVMKGFCIVTGASVLIMVINPRIIDANYMMFFVASYLVTALNNLFSYFIRAINLVKVITVSSILNTVITVSCNLVFLLGLHWGVNGYLIANVLGHLIALAYMFGAAKLHKYIVFKQTDKELRKKIIAFSIPMVVSALSWWINNSFDKYVLYFFCGTSAVGILAAAYKIPSIITIFSSIVARAFSFSVIQNFDEKDKDGFLGESYAMSSFFMSLCVSGLMLINIPLSKVLFLNEFSQAWKVVPPLVLAAMMNHMSLTCEHIFIALEETRIISKTAMVGACLNLVLNLLLIPRWEAYGAAFATTIGFGFVWLVRYIIVKKKVELKNKSKKEYTTYLLLLVQMFLAYYGGEFWLAQIGIFVAIMILYLEDIKKILEKYL